MHYIYLKLILAMQDIFPSPFYIMDEVDAALDTSTAERLGQLLKLKASTTDTQFILVSHRPELMESAFRIIGIYLLHDMPTSISHCFYA